MSSSTASRLDRLAGLHSAKRLVLRLARGDIGIHAVLFYGVPGSGKQELAHALAQAWVCQQLGEEGADGECRACGAFERRNNADFLSIAPQGASRIISVRQITNDNVKDEDPVPLLDFFRTMPIMSRHKVAVIENAHRMNASSASALLKTLEEPHPHAKLILTTDSVGGVLPTILSRCLAVACELPSLDEVRGIAPDAPDELVKMTDGAPGRILDALNNPAGIEAITRFARSLPRRPQGGALVAADEFRGICEKLASQQASGARAANAQGLELLAMFMSREPGYPARWIQATVEAHRRILGNGSAPVVFDALFADMLSG